VAVCVPVHELLAPWQQSGLREGEQRPQVPEVVLDRGAGDCQAMLRLQGSRGTGGLRVRVLDGLRLIEDDAVPELLPQ
jgi:hypothetical protein